MHIYRRREKHNKGNRNKEMLVYERKRRAIEKGL